MNISARYFIQLVIVLLTAHLVVSCRHAPAPSPSRGILKVGASEIDITPPIGYRMAGYFDERLSTAVHDPLHAKAIVIGQGRQQIAMVFCDLLGLSLNVTTNARAIASRKTGIPISNIVMCSTHSHTGPLFDDVRRTYFHEAAVAKFGNDPQEKIDYPAFLIERLVTAVVEAQSRLQPATLEAGITRQENLTFNRRYWMKNGKVAFNPGRLNPEIVRPAGPSDPEVGILLAREVKENKPFAGATVFAMHSDTVGGTAYSADYAYYLQETLRGAFGPNFISAFGAGTCGDLNHINVNTKEALKGFAMAEQLGTTLGQAVINATKELSAVTRPSLAVRSRTLDVPLQEITPEQLADARAKITSPIETKTDFTPKSLPQKCSTWPAVAPIVRWKSRCFGSMQKPLSSACLARSLSNWDWQLSNPLLSRKPSSYPFATTAPATCRP